MLNGKNLNANWRIAVSNTAQKQLRRMPHSTANKISATVDIMKIDPYSGGTEKLKDKENCWRRRIGDYRILFEILSPERTIFIYEIKRRTSNTY